MTLTNGDAAQRPRRTFRRAIHRHTIPSRLKRSMGKVKVRCHQILGPLTSLTMRNIGKGPRPSKSLMNISWLISSRGQDKRSVRMYVLQEMALPRDRSTIRTSRTVRSRFSISTHSLTHLLYPYSDLHYIQPPCCAGAFAVSFPMRDLPTLVLSFLSAMYIIHVSYCYFECLCHLDIY